MGTTEYWSWRWRRRALSNYFSVKTAAHEINIFARTHTILIFTMQQNYVESTRLCVFGKIEYFTNEKIKLYEHIIILQGLGRNLHRPARNHSSLLLSAIL